MIPIRSYRHSRQSWGTAGFALSWILGATGAGSLAWSTATAADGSPGRPNVIVILTDDQGYGDLGFHGNPKIRTPHLDRFAGESARLTRFYVSPVCSPTRSSLLTGRYNYRTGIVDTYIGRSMMHPDEVTLAELLGQAGYRTGIFGKWHLGDNYPMRPIDQGFQEALVHKGGGIGQPSDPPGGESYFDPVLQHNGQPVKTTGYCSDLFTDAALRFIESCHDQPFLVWLAFNAPHTPLEVPDSYYRRYKEMDLSLSQFPAVGHPIPKQYNPDTTAKLYGMVENIDDNVGRLLDRLDALELASRTIVIFLSDNGPQQPRYNSGLRDRKGTVFEGGIRVPCFVRWPGRLEPGREVTLPAAHIDLVPTLLEACAVGQPPSVSLDGSSLWPLLTGPPIEWPDRILFFQWHRGDVPQLGRAFAARSRAFKLVQPLGTREGPWNEPPRFLLFDMGNDPLETRDVAAQHPDTVARLEAAYEQWFKNVTGARDYTVPSRIHLGSPRENPAILTRQDWRGPNAGWGPRSIGHWEVRVLEAGPYAVTAHFPALEGDTRIRLAFAEFEREARAPAGATRFTFPEVPLPQTEGRIQVTLDRGDTAYGPRFIEVHQIAKPARTRER